jgi:hypothetical protein
MLRGTRLVVPAIVALAFLGGTAVATHLFPPQVPPGTVTTQGFFVSNSRVRGIPLQPLADATQPHGSRLFVQHAIFGPGQSTGWHSHPGPVFVMVVAGSFTHQFVKGGECHSRTYVPGQGFVDRGFGHVHQGFAGGEGAEFYATYILPPNSHAVRDPVTGTLPTPPECA